MRNCGICGMSGHRRETCENNPRTDTPEYNAPLTEDQVETVLSLKRDEKLSVQEISEQTGFSVSTILRYLSRNGISHRKTRAKTPPLSKTKWFHTQVCKKQGMTSVEAAEYMKILLIEVNRAYGTGNYQYYLDHR